MPFALVTGANNTTGFERVGHPSKSSLTTIVTSWNQNAAVQSMRAEGNLHQLHVTNHSSSMVKKTDKHFKGGGIQVKVSLPCFLEPQIAKAAADGEVVPGHSTVESAHYVTDTKFHGGKGVTEDMVAISPTTMISKNPVVALVTGANKGIGFEIVRQLSKSGVSTILTSRNQSRGSAAVEALHTEGLKTNFHQLDVTDASSIAQLVKWTQKYFKGGIDILINNAAVVGKVVPGDPVESSRRVIDTNFYGVKRVTDAILPLMKKSGRIINVSSLSGCLQHLPHEEWRKRFTPSNDQNLSMEMIDQFLHEFMEDVQAGDRSKWPQVPFWVSITDYSVSKVALNTYTRILARQLLRQGIYVCCMYPGFIKTKMTQFVGLHEADVGADTAVWLALKPDAPEAGKFYKDREIVSYEVINMSKEMEDLLGMQMRSVKLG